MRAGRLDRNREFTEPINNAEALSQVLGGNVSTGSPRLWIPPHYAEALSRVLGAYASKGSQRLWILPN